MVSEQQRVRNLERYQKINRELQAAKERISELADALEQSALDVCAKMENNEQLRETLTTWKKLLMEKDKRIAELEDFLKMIINPQNVHLIGCAIEEEAKLLLEKGKK